MWGARLRPDEEEVLPSRSAGTDWRDNTQHGQSTTPLKRGQRGRADGWQGCRWGTLLRGI